MMPPSNNKVNNEALNADAYEDIVKYLLMVYKKVKEPRVDYELICICQT
jgi:hypothetical protein